MVSAWPLVLAMARSFFKAATSPSAMVKVAARAGRPAPNNEASNKTAQSARRQSVRMKVLCSAFDRDRRQETRGRVGRQVHHVPCLRVSVSSVSGCLRGVGGKMADLVEKAIGQAQSACRLIF